MTIVYLIVIALSIYWSIQYDGQEDSAKKQHRYVLLCLLFTLITGLSYGLGADKFIYMADFSRYDDRLSHPWLDVQRCLKNQGYMPLWTLMNLVIKRWTDSFYVFQLIQALFVNSVIFYVARKWTKKIFLFATIFFVGGTYFRFNTEVMREGMAIACCLLGWDAYTRGKYVRTLVWTVAGVLFHISALIFVPIYFLPKIKITFKRLIFIQLITLAIWGASDLVAMVILPFAKSGSGELASKIKTYLMVYTSFFGFLRSYLTYLGLPSVIYYFAHNQAEEPMRQKQEKWIVYSLLVGMVACSIGGFVRLANYTWIFYLAMLSEVIYSLWRYKAHLVIRTVAVAGIICLNIWGDFTYWSRSRFYYYQFFVPYTCIADESQPVHEREIAHREAASYHQTAKRQVH